MAQRIPFTALQHSPTKAELVLSYGTEFVVVNTTTGAMIKECSSKDTPQPYSDKYRTLSFSKDGALLATSAAEDKEIKVWNTNDWSLKFSRAANKRINDMQFNHNASQIVLADKFGDVFCHPVEVEEGAEATKPLPILGHVSMVTAMLLTPDEKYVITADRDEHIRVSRFPNGYNIESFCLGHTDVVTCIRILPWAHDRMVSAGGDSTLRVWDHVKGTELQCLSLRQWIQPYLSEASDENSKDPMVNAMALNSTTQQIVLSFAKASAFVVFSSTPEGTFEYQSTVEMHAPILALAFDLEGRLWVSLAPVDQQDLLAVFTQTNNKFGRHPSTDALVASINACSAEWVTSAPDLYSVFNLRKFLEIPEQQDNEEGHGKKRRIEN